MKKILLLITLIFLASCSNNTDSVSRKEYEKVVEERDYYKEQYEQLTGNPSNENVLDIELTEDNIDEYFDFVVCELDDGYVTIVPQSKLFEEGWIYRECSHGFRITMSYNGEEIDWFSIPDVSSYGLPKDNYDFSLISVKGIVRFERIESVVEYNWDTFHGYRTVKFSDGFISQEVIFTDKYKY